MCSVSTPDSPIKLAHLNLKLSMETATSELCFDTARLDLAQRRLLIDDVPARLGARAFDILVALIERRDRVVGRNELFQVVWPNVVVEESNLQVHISALRKLLGAQAIATIPGRGYRFTAKLAASPNDAAAPIPKAHSQAPAESGPLYGRDEDLRAIDALMQRHRLVSIVGASGIGKTQLAQVIAARQRDNFPNEIYWVELAPLNNEALVIDAIAQALKVQASDERPVLETIVALLRNQNVLLALDNCEHLLDAAAGCIRTLLAQAPGLRVLVTSQEALHIPDECVYRLSGLSSDGDTAPAVALFMARAQAADPKLQLSASSRATIAEICRRLDGLPLAIELSAARVRLLGIDGVHARLDERFRVLTGGTRAVLRRHQTLRTALEWSYGLLSPDEQTVFRRLGVCVGGFTLELAQAVAADERIDRWTVLDLLGHLIDKSLIVVDGDEVPRYRMLETMRAFSLEQLATSGETSALLRRHAEALLEILLPQFNQRYLWGSTTEAEWIHHGDELDNLRAALAWAASPTGDRTLACALVGCSLRVWWIHDLIKEGIDHALRLLPVPDNLPIEIEASFNLTLASLGYKVTRRECFDAAMRASELYRSMGNTPRRIDALLQTAIVGSRLGNARQSSDAIAGAEVLIDPQTPYLLVAGLALARSLHHLYLGRYEQAIASSQQQAALYRDAGRDWGAYLAQSNAAWYECAIGRFDSAIAELLVVLEALRRTNAPYGIGQVLAYLASAHALRGDRAEALAYGREAVPYLQRGGVWFGCCCVSRLSMSNLAR